MYEPATTVEEAKALIEAGFSYECEVDGIKLFKKIKWYEVIQVNVKVGRERFELSTARFLHQAEDLSAVCSNQAELPALLCCNT